MNSKQKTFFFILAAGLTFGGNLSYTTSPRDDFKMSQIFSIDAGHSYVGFSIKYMGFAKVRGRFADFAGAIRCVDGDVAKTSATVIIKTASLDTDHEFRDKDLKSANWFDAEKFPVIKFQSKRIENSASGTEVIGDLTIKDVTKEVRIKMEGSSGIQKDIREDTQVIFTGSTTINRKEFGVMGENWSRVKEGMTAVASEVEIELSILGKQINAPNFRNWVRNVEMPQGKIYQTITTKGLTDSLKEFDIKRPYRTIRILWLRISALRLIFVSKTNMRKPERSFKNCTTSRATMVSVAPLCLPRRSPMSTKATRKWP
ncbi:YceI family protein [candidate division KSB1 bacterium]|nr:YceI family protein [candidate division KSB1 bacterium]